MEGLSLKTKLLIGCVSLLSMFLLTGCGESKELSNFKSQMDDFFTAIADIDTEINSIDATSDTAFEQLLENMDLLETQFQTLAAIEVPEEFIVIESLADEAGEYMTMAVEHYHEAYEGETFNADTASIASQYYERAYKRVQYIVTFLHGEIPDDESIQFVPQSETE